MPSSNARRRGEPVGARRLNGRAIDKPEPLADGDEIGIGEVTLRVSRKRS